MKKKEKGDMCECPEWDIFKVTEEGHLKFMQAAIDQAKKSMKEGGIPIGSVLVHNGEVVGKGHNQRVQKDRKFYRNSILYSTLSPCDMCSGCALFYGIRVIVFGENETTKGPEEYVRQRGVKVINLNLDVCKNMMTEFIEKHPDIWHEDSCGGPSENRYK